MKSLQLLLIITLLLTACTHGPKKRLHGTQANYPFKKDSTYDWQINPDPENTLVVLNALKAEEKGDTTALRKYYAESPVFNTDSLRSNITLAQLQQMLAHTIARKTFRVKVNDWQSVINKDHSEAWVTVWYTQYTTTLTGQTDSVQCVSKNKVENGKIVQVNEFVRHFPVLSRKGKGKRIKAKGER